MKIIAALAVMALAVLNSASAFTTFSKYGSVIPPEGDTLQGKHMNVQWFENYVDHFNPQDTSKYKQRYFENREFFNETYDKEKSNSPIFVYIGSEGILSPKWTTQGLPYTLAKEHGAIVVALEHRYYGFSQPKPDHSFENLRYLTSEQALEDLATFIRWYVNNQVTWSRERPVIVFGGSYGATLAATMRARHPHLVRGAVASSAPFEPEVNFTEYYEVATEALRFFGGDECVDTFKDLNNQIENHLKTQDGKKLLSLMFNTCTPLYDGSFTGINTQAFWTSVTDIWAGVVQYNKENSSRLTLSNMCKSLRGASDKFSEYFRLFQAARGGDTKCFKWTYNDMLADLSSTTIEPANNMRQWIYQTCTEWGFYQTLESDKQVYGPKDAVKLELFTKLCADAYSPKINTAFLLDSSDRSRDAYGGWYYQATNVALANGNIDPWHAISLFEKCGHRHPSITNHFSEGTSHCAILYPEEPYDPASIIQARKEVAQVVADWIKARY